MPRSVLHRVILASLAAACALALGCRRGGEPDAVPPGDEGGYVECVVPRPELCTQHWRPVCGLRDTGVRCVTTPCPSWERKTFANACEACADGGVYGWRPGECPEEGPLEDG